MCLFLTGVVAMLIGTTRGWDDALVLLEGPFGVVGVPRPGSDWWWADVVLLAAIAAHPVWPRWWTACFTVLGFVGWWGTGWLAMHAGC